jgi:hypothetical protein
MRSTKAVAPESPEEGDMDTTIDRLLDLGEVITRQGVAAASVELLLLAHDARDAGIEQVLVDIMIDEDAPDMVRERAFGLVACRLAALIWSGSVSEMGELSSRVGAAR